MQKCYLFTILSIFLLGATTLQAQRIVPVTTDPMNPTDIFQTIMGDTTATGERVDNNTVYQLQNGGVYISSGRIVNKPEWPLQIEAADLTDTDNKAIITRVPNASGDFQDIMRSEGDVTFRNIWIISGEKGALEQHDWGKMRILGENSRIIVQDCIIEKDRGGFLQLRANGVKMYVENTVLRNGGNRRIIQGNGRGIDARDFALDTLIMHNVIVHNIQDRFFRSQGGTAPHNYIEIDHCTSFNTIGRHGHIQLGRVRNAKITNNVFMNPIMLGSSPVYTNEQTQPDNDLHKVITIDTLLEDTNLEIAANNIFWTEDVTNYWASNDTVSAPGVLSDLVMDNLGAAASDAFFSEVLELESVPTSILQYVIDLYDNPEATDMFDFIVEDQVVAGTAFDSGNLFDFSSFSPCYAPSAMSATAGLDGGPIGAVDTCEDLLNDINELNVNAALALAVAPNPVSATSTLSFTTSESGRVALSVYDLMGRQLVNLHDGFLMNGTHQFDWAPSDAIKSGMYIVYLRTEEGQMSTRVVVSK
ncbi:MAG: T9SS type A sorting domain-containing protein [Bacteroidota bacterium]